MLVGSSYYDHQPGAALEKYNSAILFEPGICQTLTSITRCTWCRSASISR